MTDIAFGFQAAAAGEPGTSDEALYLDLIDDCALGHRLGYDAAWLLEHISARVGWVERQRNPSRRSRIDRFRKGRRLGA
jgi:hypothetical protein